MRAALTSLDKAGKVAKSGEGTSGKPFTYEVWFPTKNSPDSPKNGPEIDDAEVL